MAIRAHQADGNQSSSGGWQSELIRRMAIRAHQADGNQSSSGGWQSELIRRMAIRHFYDEDGHQALPFVLRRTPTVTRMAFRASYLMREAIRRNRRSSEAIRAHRMAFRASYLMREAIRRNRRSSEAIRAHRMAFRASYRLMASTR
jgi:hypothetical protein